MRSTKWYDPALEIIVPFVGAFRGWLSPGSTLAWFNWVIRPLVVVEDRETRFSDLPCPVSSPVNG